MRRLLLATIAGAAALLVPATAQAIPTISSLAPATVRFGAPVTAKGTVDSLAAGEHVHLEQQINGMWTQVGIAAVTTAGGAYAISYTPKTSGSLKAVQTTGTLGESPVSSVAVAPKLELGTVGAATAYYPVTVRVSVLPRTFSGTVRVKIDGAGTALATTTIQVRKGVGQKSVTPKGAGRFRLRGTTASPVWAPASATGRLVVTGRTLTVGTYGPDVRALQSRLATLGFLIPGTGDRYSFSTSEVTLAFQKSYGLSRTYVWGSREWATLATLKHGPKARYSDGGKLHIEVDKTRQTLMVAQGTKVLGIIAVSTGATGNTPVGTFHIYQRGGSHLYRFMAFHGNFGIHGYTPVPAHPASHGCVREPMWAASFTWNHSAIGTPVHVIR